MSPDQTSGDPSRTRRRGGPPPAPPAAQVRSASPLPTPPASGLGPEARTRTSPSRSSAAPIATAVCEPLCGSTPIITAAINGSFIIVGGKDRSGHARFQGCWRCAPFEPHQGKDRQAGTSLLSQTASGRQAVREPAHRTPERYGQSRNAYLDSSIRRRCVRPLSARRHERLPVPGRRPRRPGYAGCHGRPWCRRPRVQVRASTRTRLSEAKTTIVTSTAGTQRTSPPFTT